MKQKLFITLIFSLLTSLLYAQYVPDVLGEPYLRRSIKMPDDNEGKVICT